MTQNQEQVLVKSRRTAGWVLDPFAGSGTTAHAARALGRRFVVVEKDLEEFDKMVATLRGEQIPLLGQEPV